MKTPSLPALVAAMTATALLAACSGGTNAANDSGSGGGGTLTLASVDQGSIEDVVKAFEAANPGVEVRFTTSGADQYQQQIRTQLASGTAPDVMSVWPGNGNPGATYVLAKPGYLLDLSDQPWAAKLPEAVKTVAQYEGKTYNGIFGLNAIGAIYNEQAMDKAGLTPPGTWTELLAFCRAAAAKGTPAFALGNQDNWVTQLVAYALVATVVYAPDRDFDKKMQAGQATFAGSAVDDRAGQVPGDGEDRLLPEEPARHQLRGEPDPRRHRQDARPRPGQLGDRPAQGEEPDRHVHPQAAAGHRRPGRRSSSPPPPAPATASTPRPRTRTWR